MNKYRDIMGRLNYALFLTVVALLPFPQLFLRYACVAWIIAWVLELRWLEISNIKFQLSNSKFTIPFLLFGLWFIWNLISGLWAEDHEAWSWQMERYITFGVIMPIGIWGVNAYYNWEKIGKVFIISCLITTVFYPALLTLFLHHREIIDNHPFLHRLWDYSSFDWFYFYTTNFSHIKHRLFWGAVETMGIAVATKLWYPRHKWLWAVTSFVMAFSVLLAGSRQATISMIVIGLIALYWILSERLNWRYSIGIMTAAMLLIGVMLALLHPRIKNTHIQTEVRTQLWETALEQPDDYLWSGLGSGQDGVYLSSRLPKNEELRLFDKRGHCHNQYLQELMELGVFGLLLFIIAWFSIPLCAPVEKRRIAILFTVLYACNMLTDCMFGNFCGIALWAVGMVFIFAPSLPTSLASSREECKD